MKRLFILLSFICICAVSFAQYNDMYYGKNNEYDKYYDIYKQTLKISSAETFWEELRSVNKDFKKLEKKEKKWSKTMQEAVSEYQDMFVKCLDLRNLLEANKLHVDISDSLLSWTKANRSKSLHTPEMYIIPSQVYNASAYPYETRMVIFTEAIVKLLDKEELTACAAHELAHYFLKHQLAHIYKAKKKEKSNKLWASFGTALYAGVMAGSNMYGATQGAEPLDIDYDGLVSGVNDELERVSANASLMFKFRYSREQEMEADIIALAFLRKAGMDCNKIISLLRKLQPYSPETFDKHDDHPLISERIKVLNSIIKKFPQ